MKTVSLLWVKGLLQAASLQGFTDVEVLKQANVSIEKLSQGRLSLTETLSIWRAVEQLTADSLFGFHMGLSLKPTQFKLIAFTMLSSPTLGDAIEKILKYQRLISDGGDFTLVPNDSDEISLIYKPTADNFSYHQIDAVIAMVIGFARWLLDRNIVPQTILLTHGEQAGLIEYQDFYSCDIKFNQTHNSIVFPALLLKEPLPGYDAQLASMHQNMADNQLQRLSDSNIVVRLQQLLASSTEAISRDRVAEKMGMSGRSLQRKLQEQGSSFQQVYDDYRHQRAIELLQNDNLPLLNISLQLGFSESSTFYRAFKRWQGVTPGEYRQQILAE